jgi:peptide/nickel transport system substrate-binding protein
MNRQSDKATQTPAHQLSRRDFLGGVAATVGGTILAGTATPLLSETAMAQGATATPVAVSGAQVSMGWQKPTNFDPLFTQNGFEEEVQRLIFSALVKMNDKLEPVPDLAETIDISPDAKTYTFHLKKLTFSDGQPLTAKDVVFTINRAVDKRTGSVWRGRLLKIQGATEYGDQKAESISGLETPDDYTVKITLIDPDSTFLVTLADFSGFGILPEHVVKDVPPDQLQKHPFTLNPNVSAGAFTFAHFATDQYLELDRNDAYTGGPKPPLRKIFLKIVTPDNALAQMDTGDLDIFGPGSLPVAEMDMVKKNPNLTLVSVPSPSVSFIAINFEKPYLQDKRIRQAMQYAIDREGIVTSFYKGEATVVNSTIIGPDWMGTPAGLNAYTFDPDKAKQLLKEANWDSSRNLAMIFPPGDQLQESYAAVIQQQFKDVGIDITLDESEQFGTRLVDSGDYDLALAGGGVFRADPNVSAKYFETVNFTPAGANYSHYSNTALDDLFKSGRATPDKAQRKEIYTKAAAILNDELPWIFLWSPNSIFTINKRVVGFKPPAYVDNKLWNAEEWSVTS